MYHVTVLFAVAASFLARGRAFRVVLPGGVRLALEHWLALPLALVALLAAEHAYLALVADASFHQSPDYRVFARLPIRIVNGLHGPIHIAESYGTRFMLLAIVESAALFAIYASLARPRRWQIVLVAVAALTACVDAVGARAGTSADMYSYVGFALLGKLAYAPPNVAFPGEFAVINAWWGTPMVPAPYGPFWMLVAGSVATLGSTLLAKIVALRLLGVVALVSTTAALVALRVPLKIVALLAINPALIFEFVANVHNDLFAMALLLFARLAASRKAIALAIALAVLAALVKIPFVLFAALSLAPIARRNVRLAAFGSVVVLTIGISWLWGWSAYVAALFHHVGEHTTNGPLDLVRDPIFALKIVAGTGVAFALVGNVWLEGFAYALPTIGAAFFPWYLSWPLAYVAQRETMLRNFAIALPIVVIATDDTLGNGPLVGAIEAGTYVSLALACGLLVYRRRRDARLAAAS